MFVKLLIYSSYMNSCFRPSVRYGHQSDVKELNRLLVGANEDLKKQISELKVKLVRCSRS